MIFNQDVIRRKSAALDLFFSRTLQSVIDDLVRLFTDVRDVRMLPRPWYPGGGSVLLLATIQDQSVFVKIKDKQLTVEGRLESEPGFSGKSSLQNETDFCRLLSDDPQVPELMAYAEDDTWAYEVFECLTPFEEGVAGLSADERVQAFADIEGLLRRLHARGIVHGDVHEKNILFRGKQAVLCDFEEARFFTQQVPFEASLDVVGENRYGNLGLFPDGHGLAGLTCLNRLRQVFRPLIEQALPALLEESRITVEDWERPFAEERLGILTRLLDVLGEPLGASLHVVDAGADLGAVAFTAAGSAAVKSVLAFEARPERVRVSRILGHLLGQDKVRFVEGRPGVVPFAEGPVDVLMLFSFYSRLEDKDDFLQAVARQRPRALIAEMEVPARHYPQRGSVGQELRHMAQVLGFRTTQLIGYTVDRGLPLCVLSDLPLLPRDRLDWIMGLAQNVAPLAGPVADTPSRAYPLKVSVVLPVDGDARHAQEVVRALTAQTFKDFELIVVDDGADGKTIERLSAGGLAGVRVIRPSRPGLVGALNDGFSVAGGEYLTWLHPDDRVEPQWLASLVAALDGATQDVGVAFGGFDWLHESGQAEPVPFAPSLTAWAMLLRRAIPAFLFRARLLGEVGPFDSDAAGVESLDMGLRLTQVTHAVRLEEVLCHQHYTGGLDPDGASPARVQAIGRMIGKYIASSGGRLDVDRVFPGLAQSPNPVLARWQAKIWLAGRLARHSFCPVDAVVGLLLAALQERFESFIVGNIVYVLARQNAWEPARQILLACMKQDQSEAMQALARSVERRDLQGIPLTLLDDEALAFDLYV